MPSSPDTGVFVIFTLGLIAVAVAVAVYIISRRRLRERIYGGRKALHPTVYYETFFADSGFDERTVILVLETLNVNSGLDFSRIDPDEPFDERVAELLDTDAWVGFEWDIEDRLRWVGPVDVDPFRTVRELVHSIDKKQKDT